MSKLNSYLQLKGSSSADFQQSLTATDAVDLLKSGNERFLTKKPAKREREALLEGAAQGQAPYAAVLGCIDSRAPIEEVFDASLSSLACLMHQAIPASLTASFDFASSTILHFSFQPAQIDC